MTPSGETSAASTGRYLSATPDRLTAAQADVYASITEGPRRATADVVPIIDDDGRLLGPFALMAIAPQLGEAVQALGAALRFHGRFGPVTREVAILAVAAHHRCHFEWFAHEPAARTAGVTDEQLDAVREGAEPPGLDPEAAAAWRALRPMLTEGGLDDDAYAAAIGALGEEGLAELVWLHGYYSMLASALAAFDPVLPAAARGIFTEEGTHG